MDLIQNHIIWSICRVVVHHIFCFLKWGSKWEILFGAKIGNFPISLKESNTLQSTSLLKPLDEFTIKLISYLLYAVQLCIMYFIYFLHWGSQRGILLCLLGAGGISEPLAHLDLCFWSFQLFIITYFIFLYFSGSLSKFSKRFKVFSKSIQNGKRSDGWS